MKRRALKTWLYEAGKQFGVNPRTLFGWYRRGYFDRSNFVHHNARVVDVLGDPVLRQRPGIGPRRLYDFTGVDLSQSSTVIARQLGCHHSLVHYWRRKLRRV